MTEGEKKLRLAEINRQIIELKARSTGRTTRIIDSTIQWLFEHPGEWATVCDHYDERRATCRLIKLLIGRLKAEHPGIEIEKYDIDHNATRIRIKNEPSRESINFEIARLEELREQIMKEEPSDKYLSKFL